MNQLLDNLNVKLANAVDLADKIQNAKEEMESNLEKARQEYKEWYEGQYQQNKEDQQDAIANEWAGTYNCAYPGASGDDQPH